MSNMGTCRSCFYFSTNFKGRDAEFVPVNWCYFHSNFIDEDFLDSIGCGAYLDHTLSQRQRVYLQDRLYGKFDFNGRMFRIQTEDGYSIADIDLCSPTLATDIFDALKKEYNSKVYDRDIRK